MSEKIKQKRELSLRETICYSTGEMGTNMLFAVMGAYLLVYYTNYAHVDPLIVGTTCWCLRLLMHFLMWLWDL